MRKLFTMIPEISAVDLPDPVENELRDWNEELCFHGDGGCVFTIGPESMKELPLFRAWMIEIGAWTEREAHTITYEDFCKEHGLNERGEPWHFDEYYKFLDGRPRHLSVAMTGT